MDDRARVGDAARKVVDSHDPHAVSSQEFLGACFDAGLSWVHFPEGLGGLGVSRGLQAAADTILQAAGGPSSNGSMRAVLLKRGNQTIATIDLYDYLTTGNSAPDVRVEANDVIFVQPNEVHQFRNTGERPMRFLCLIPNSAAGKSVKVAPECGVQD